MVEYDQVKELQGELQKGPNSESNNETMGNKQHLTWQRSFNWISNPLVNMNLDMVTKVYNYVHKHGHKSKLLAAAIRSKQDVFSLLGVDYTISTLMIMQLLKESAASYNFNCILGEHQQGPKGESNNETTGNKRHLTWQSHFNWISNPPVNKSLDTLKSPVIEEEDVDIRALNMNDFKDGFEQVKGAATTGLERMSNIIQWNNLYGGEPSATYFT